MDDKIGDDEYVTVDFNQPAICAVESHLSPETLAQLIEIRKLSIWEQGADDVERIALLIGTIIEETGIAITARRVSRGN